MQSDGLALRKFGDMLQKPESDIAKHPGDFSIWHVGTWNDATGELTGETKKCLAYAIDLLTPNEEN